MLRQQKLNRMKVDLSNIPKTELIDEIVTLINEKEDVKAVKVPAEVKADKTAKDRIDLEQKLRKEFN